MQFRASTEKNETISTQLELNRLQLKQVIRDNVKQLVHSIFPIECEGQTYEEDSESLLKVKDALADASQTAYVRGQWVYSDTGHGGRYRIAGAYLPGTGDMARKGKIRLPKRPTPAPTAPMTPRILSGTSCE